MPPDRSPRHSPHSDNGAPGSSPPERGSRSISKATHFRPGFWGALFRRPVTLLGLVASIGLVHALVETTASFEQRLLGASLGALAAGAWWRYLRLNLFHRLPMAEFGLAQLYVFFGTPTITGALERSDQPATDQGITLALVACHVFALAAVTAAPLGAWLGRGLRTFAERALPAQLAGGGRKILPAWIAIVIIANTAALWWLPESLQFAVSVVASSYGLLLYVGSPRFDGEPRPRVTRRLLAVACAIGAGGLLTGMLTAVLTPLLVALVIVLMSQRRVALTWILAGVLVFLVLNPAKHAFRRAQGWGHFDKERRAETLDVLLVGPEEAAATWWDAIESEWFGAGETSTNTDGSLDRLNYLSTVARTIDFAGRRVPYDEGSRWPLILHAFVPRIINAEKPDFTKEFNNRFCVLFGIQTERGTRSTTVAFPVISDGYWNFGWFGVGLVGLIIGCFWGFASSLWQLRHWGLSWLALALFMDSRMTASLHGQIGSLPQTILGLVTATWVIGVVCSLLSGRTGRPSRHLAATAPNRTPRP